jgi:hypothetical protein
MTDAEFGQGMALLLTAFPNTDIDRDDARRRLYFMALGDIDAEAWRAGVLTAIQTLKFFPAIAELRAACTPRTTLIAARMYDQVVALKAYKPNVRHDGWPTLERVGETLGQAAMEAYTVAGGPAVFAQADDLTWVRKAFVEEYQRARAAGVGDVAALPPDPRFTQLAAGVARGMGADYKRLASGDT